MSVIISTTFSRNGAFFAGEKFGCTISFTNSLPSASQSQRRNPISSLRPIEESPVAGRPRIHHTRSNSDPLKDVAVEKGEDTGSKSNGLLVAIPMVKSASSSDGDSAAARKPMSLTSLATSTVAYFTGGEKEPRSSIRALDLKQTEADIEPHRVMTTKYEKHEGEITAGLVNLRTAELSKALSESDVALLDDSTPRSSIDFSNNSDVLSRSSFDSTRPSHRRSSLKPILLPTQTRRTETLLWSFAQVVGHFVVDASIVNATEFEVLKSRTMYRPLNDVGTGGPVGGGSLGVFGFGLGSNGIANGSELDERSLPVFSTPPSILFVDLQLAPGETKTFSYELTLPSDLPPSHRGKSIRFNYNLIISTQRGALNRPSHSVQLPFRVFNHISEDGSRPIYDLMNPVIMHRDEAVVKTVESVLVSNDNEASRKDFMRYVNELIGSNAGGNLSLPSPKISRRENEIQTSLSSQESKSCLNTINTITRPFRKAFYDICKGNERVAQLYLVKTAFRLGEVVSGIISFMDCAVPSYRVSVTLESSELVEQTIALRPVHQIARISRKNHAEHHEFCLNTSRTSFALCIPPSMSPEFFTTAVRLQWHIRLEFITGTAQDHPILPIISDDRHRHNQAVQEVPVNTFDCLIPIKVFPGEVGDVRGFNVSNSICLT